MTPQAVTLLFANGQSQTLVPAPKAKREYHHKLDLRKPKTDVGDKWEPYVAVAKMAKEMESKLIEHGLITFSARDELRQALDMLLATTPNKVKRAVRQNS